MGLFKKKPKEEPETQPDNKQDKKGEKSATEVKATQQPAPAGTSAKTDLKVVAPPKPATTMMSPQTTEPAAIAVEPSAPKVKSRSGVKPKPKATTAEAGPHVLTDESILGKTNLDATLSEALTRLAQYEKENDRIRQCVVLNKLGLIYKAKDDLPKAIESMEKSLTIAEKLQNISVQATILRNLGSLYLMSNDFVKALKAQEESLRLKRQLGDKLGEAESEEVLANNYEDRGEFEKSIEHLKKAVFIYDTLGNADSAARLEGEIERVEELADEMFEEEFHTFQYTKSNQIHTVDIFHVKDFKEDLEI